MTYTRNSFASLVFTAFLSLSLVALKASPRAYRFFPGYFVQKNGDTVLCEIDYKDWAQNPSMIVVRINGEEKNLTTEDISGFAVTGYAAYKSANVTYHPDPVSGTDFPDQFSDRTETNSYFLKIMVDGPYCLYELQIPGKYVFFAGRQAGPPVELIYRVKLVDGVLMEDMDFRNTLTSYFRQEGIEQENINLVKSAGYHLSDLRKLVNRLNEHRVGKKTPKRQSEVVVQLDVFGGAVFQNFSTAFNSKYSVNNKFGSKVGPIGGLNFLAQLPNRFHAIAFGISVGYLDYSFTVDKAGSRYNYQSAAWYSTTVYTERISMKRSELQVNLYARYLFNPTGRIKPYLKAGLLENFAINGNHDIYDAYSGNTTGITNGVNPFTYNIKETITVYSLGNFDATLTAAVGIAAGNNKLECIVAFPQRNIGTTSMPYRISSYGLCYYYTFLR